MTNGSSKIAMGRPPGVPGIRAQAARYAQDCLRVLAAVANNAHAPEADRVRAAEVILDHATRPPRASSAAPEDET